MGFSRQNSRGEEYCQSVVRVITGACVWWNGNVDSDADVCILCKSMKDSVEHFLYACSALDTECLALINETSMHVADWCTFECVVTRNVQH